MPARISIVEIEAELRKFANAHDPAKRTATIYNKWPKRTFGLKSVIHHFGSFRKGLDHYGIEHSAPRTSHDPRTIDEMINHFDQVWTQHEVENRHRERLVPPSEGVLTRYNRLNASDGPCAETYRRHWGSFRQFALAFGRFKRGEMAREALKAMAVSGSKVSGPGDQRGDVERAMVDRGGAAKAKQKIVPKADTNVIEGQRAPVSRPRRRERIPTWMRDEILRTANGYCQVPGCGRELGLSTRVDHVVPVSAGGETTITNLRATCDPCNRAKSDSLIQPIMGFFHMMGYRKLPAGVVEHIAKKWRGDEFAGEMLQDLTVIARYANEGKVR